MKKNLVYADRPTEKSIYISFEQKSIGNGLTSLSLFYTLEC